MPRTARLEANAVDVCRRAILSVSVRTLPMSGALPQPNLDVSGTDASAAEEVLAFSSAPISSWESQVDLHNSECVSASEGLRDSSITSMPQLFSSSGDTAGSETIAPSGSDDVVDLEACGPARSKVNDVNDTSSRSKSKSATGVFNHGASDPMQPSCDSINGNDTATMKLARILTTMALNI